MTREKLQLNRKFLVIESPIPFEIYCPEQDDGVKRRQGSWQMTIHDLLTKSHYPLNPIYNLELIYDETLLNENESVTWYTTDLNLGEALRGIDGQLVTFGGATLNTEVTNFPQSTEVSNFPQSTEVSNFPKSIEVSNFPQSTEVSNFPQSIEVSNFPQSIEVSNFPQSIEVSNFPQSINSNTYLYNNVSANCPLRYFSDMYELLDFLRTKRTTGIYPLEYELYFKTHTLNNGITYSHEYYFNSRLSKCLYKKSYTDSSSVDHVELEIFEIFNVRIMSLSDLAIFIIGATNDGVLKNISVTPGYNNTKGYVLCL